VRGSVHERPDPVTRAGGARAGGISSHERADQVTRKIQAQEFKGGGRAGARADPATSKQIWSLELVLQGRVVFLATSEWIRSPEQAPSTKRARAAQGQIRSRASGSGHQSPPQASGSGHQQHKAGWRLPAAHAWADLGTGLGGPLD
jgi:hypothetical protein